MTGFIFEANQPIKAERESAGNTLTPLTTNEQMRFAMADTVQSQNPITRNDKITSARLRELLSYDTDSGAFSWNSSKKKGQSVGFSMPNGYRGVALDGRIYLCHRLAWLWVTGSHPVAQIDHINGRRTDNRFCNLRAATCSQNRHNVGLRVNNKSGLKGVSWHRRDGKWKACVYLNYRAVFAKKFTSKTDAAVAYNYHATLYLGEFARLNEISIDSYSHD